MGRWWVLALSLLLAGHAAAGPMAEHIPPVTAADNAEMLALYTSDQQFRSAFTGDSSTLDWDAISAQDQLNETQVLALLAAGKIHTARDYFCAATVMQHGETAEQLNLAYAFATLSAQLDASNTVALWLTAASWDRLLMRQNKPQWYATQYHREKITDPWTLWPIDETAVTDADRSAHNCPSLQAAKDRLTTLNQH